MKLISRALAAAEVALVLPAGLFMAALIARDLQPPQSQPAHAAQRVVAWYAARPGVGLWVLLVALPLLALVTGSGMLLHAWRGDAALRRAAGRVLAALRAHLAALVIAAATLAAGGILAIVALHMAAN